MQAVKSFTITRIEIIGDHLNDAVSTGEDQVKRFKEQIQRAAKESGIGVNFISDGGTINDYNKPLPHPERTTSIHRESQQFSHHSALPGSFLENHDTDMSDPPQSSDVVYPIVNAEHTTDPEGDVSILRSQINSLTTRKIELEQDLVMASTEKASFSDSLSKISQERDELLRRNQLNQVKIRRLNDMIVQNSQKSDEPLDEEILREMYKIRNMAAEVIKSYYPGEAKINTNKVSDLKRMFQDPYYANFYSRRLKLEKSPETRRRLLISLLFEELQNYYFKPTAKRFGLPKHMEPSLQELERMIEQNPKVDYEDSLSWTTSTVSYISRLGLSQEETIQRHAERLFNILSPMILSKEDKYGKQDKTEVDNLFGVLFNLCDAALHLALRFRASKTNYEFVKFSDNALLKDVNQDYVKKLDSQGPISKPMEVEKLHIYCTLFGALLKTRPPLVGEKSEPILLEPAHIIVWEPALSQPR